MSLQQPMPGTPATAPRRTIHPLSGYPAPEGLPEKLGKTLIGTMDHSKLLGTGKGYMNSYDYVINPYSGCQFGCSYCYASNFRTSDLQKEEWGNWVQVKDNAARQMGEIKKNSLNRHTLYMSTATDPYQPVERLAGIARQILEIIAQNHPEILLVIQTRSTLVTRDADLFLAIVQAGGQVQVNMTISTDDDQVRRTYEPGCSSVQARLKAVQALNRQGIQTCVTLTPMLPMSDPVAFIQDLIGSGTRRFILQPFRYQPNDQRSFIARTDVRAIDCAKAHYETDDALEAIRLYNADYLRSFRVIQEFLFDRPDIYLGIDRDGFRPPFDKPAPASSRPRQQALSI